MGNVSLGRLEDVAGETDAYILTWFKWRVRPSIGELKKVREQAPRRETVCVDDRQYELYKEVTATVLFHLFSVFELAACKVHANAFIFTSTSISHRRSFFMNPCKYIVHCSRFCCRSDCHYLAMFYKAPRSFSGRCTVESIILLLTAQRRQRLGLGLSCRQLKLVLLTKQPQLCARYDQLAGDLLVQKAAY